jgi:hypothetical protein
VRRLRPRIAMTGLVLLAALLALASYVPAANAATVPARAFTCLAGLPAAALGWETECENSTPSVRDMGRPIDTAVAPGEHTLYVLERAENVTVDGGEVSVDNDTIVQEHLEGDAPPKFVSCISPEVTPDCSRAPGSNILFHAYSMVLAPAKASLYVASLSGVARFRVSGSGSLSFAECLGTSEKEGAQGVIEECSRPTGSQTESATATLTLARDERDMYFLGESGLRDIHLGAEGQMTAGACYELRDRCAWNGGGFGYAAVTSNGEWILDVMSQSFYAGQVNVYRRLPDGSLVFTSCLSGYNAACPTVHGPSIAFSEPKTLVVAPNNRDVYFTGERNSSMPNEALVHLRLKNDGTLEFVGCEALDVPGCATYAPQDEGNEMWTPAKTLAITPDGSRLLRMAGSALEVYRLNPDSGIPEWESCAGGGAFCEVGAISGPSGQGGSVEMGSEEGTAWVAGEGDAYGVLLNATANEEAPPATPGATSVMPEPNENEEWGSPVQFSAQTPAQGSRTVLSFETETGSGEIHYFLASGKTQEGATWRVETNQVMPRATTVRARLVAHSAAGTAVGPWSVPTATDACEETEPPESWESNTHATASSLLVWGLIAVNCQKTEIRLEYGETPLLGQTAAVPPSALEVGRRWQPYYLEVSGLNANTTYYYRVRAKNHGGAKEISDEHIRTSPTVPAVEMSASTTAAIQTDPTSAKLDGEVWPGSAPVTAGVEIFEDTESGLREKETIQGAVVDAAEGPVRVTSVATDLQCGRRYAFRTIATAEYGESRGIRVPFELNCAGHEKGSETEENKGGEESGSIEETAAGGSGEEVTGGEHTPSTGMSTAFPQAPSVAETPVTRSPPLVSDGASAVLLAVRGAVLRRGDDGRTLIIKVSSAQATRAKITVFLRKRRGASGPTVRLRTWTVAVVSGSQTLKLTLDSTLLRVLAVHRGWDLSARIRQDASPSLIA